MSNVKRRTPSAHRDDESCPECGIGQLTTVSTKMRFQYGVGADSIQIEATVPVRRCRACRFQFLDKDGEVKQHEAVCTYLGVMSPAQIRKLRRNLGLSRAELAHLSGLGEATIARWERGSLIQNKANDRYLKLLAHDENLKRLRKYTGAEAV